MGDLDQRYLRWGEISTGARIMCAIFFGITSLIFAIVGISGGYIWVALLPFLGVLASAFYSYQLEIDFKDQTWARQTGLLGISKAKKGDFSDLQSLEIGIFNSRYGHSFPVTLKWKGGRLKSFQVRSSANLVDGAQFARALSDKLGIPLVQSHDLAAYRRKNEVPQGILPPSE